MVVSRGASRKPVVEVDQTDAQIVSPSTTPRPLSALISVTLTITGSWARTAPRVSNTAKSSVSLVSGFGF